MDINFIANRVTQLRLEKNISEYELSYGLGRSKTYINQLTSGYFQPSVVELLNICDYFGISPSEFFNGYDCQDIFSNDADVFLRKFCRLSTENKEFIMEIIDRFGSME